MFGALVLTACRNYPLSVAIRNPDTPPNGNQEEPTDYSSPTMGLDPSFPQLGEGLLVDGSGESFMVTLPDRVGVYRSDLCANAGLFSLDVNGNHTWGEGDSALIFGLPNDFPVAGDWNGDGFSEIGVFRDGIFSLDLDGDGIWDPVRDTSFQFGYAGDQVLSGDWNSDGRTDIAVFRPNAAGAGYFYLDANGNQRWDEADVAFAFGYAGDQAFAGDWNADGQFEVGVFRPNSSGGGVFYLDANGNRGWDAGDASFLFGLGGDRVVIGDWNSDHRSDLAVFRANSTGGGTFYLDQNGNRDWDEGDIYFNFGLAGDFPLAGIWRDTGLDAILLLEMP